MIGYLSEFGLANISYLEWMIFAYPMLLLEIPLAVLVLWITFTPKKKIMDSAVRKLKVQVAKTGNFKETRSWQFLYFNWFFCAGFS